MPSNCGGIARTATGLDEKVKGESTHGQGSSRSVQGEAAGGPDLGSPPRAGAGPHVGRVSWQQQKRLVIMGPAGPRPDGFVSNFFPPRKERRNSAYRVLYFGAIQSPLLATPHMHTFFIYVSKLINIY